MARAHTLLPAPLLSCVAGRSLPRAPGGSSSCLREERIRATATSVAPKRAAQAIEVARAQNPPCAAAPAASGSKHSFANLAPALPAAGKQRTVVSPTRWARELGAPGPRISARRRKGYAGVGTALVACAPSRRRISIAVCDIGLAVSAQPRSRPMLAAGAGLVCPLVHLGRSAAHHADCWPSPTLRPRRPSRRPRCYRSGCSSRSFRLVAELGLVPGGTVLGAAAMVDTLDADGHRRSPTSTKRSRSPKREHTDQLNSSNVHKHHRLAALKRSTGPGQTAAMRGLRLGPASVTAFKGLGRPTLAIGLTSGSSWHDLRSPTTSWRRAAGLRGREPAASTLAVPADLDPLPPGAGRPRRSR